MGCRRYPKIQNCREYGCARMRKAIAELINEQLSETLRPHAVAAPRLVANGKEMFPDDVPRSCCQTLTTDHPFARNSLATRRSRCILIWIRCVQKAQFDLGSLQEMNGTTVPKAAIDENDDFLASKCEIWATG